MAATWRQIHEITSQMSEDQLDQPVLLEGDCWEGVHLGVMSEEDVKQYGSEHGPDPNVKVGTPYLSTWE